MAILLKNKDADLTATAPYLETDLVLPAGCKYANVFQGDNAGRNLVRGALKPDVIGSPEISADGYITLKPKEAYINTRIQQSEGLSAYVVCRSPKNKQTLFIMSNQGSSGPDGKSDGIGWSFSSTAISWRVTTKAGNTWNNQAFLQYDTDKVYALAARVDPAPWGDQFIMNTGEIKNSALPNMTDQALKLGGDILLGSTHVDVADENRNPIDVYAVVIFDNRVSSFTQIHAFFKDVLAGIVEI